MHKRFEVAVSLKIKPPFLFPAIESADFGVDAVQMRRNGKPIIPQDQFQGVIRDLWDGWYEDWGQSKGKPHADQFLGRASDVGSNIPNRARIVFNDLHSEAKASEFVFNRIEIDDLTGTTQSGSLAFFELSAPIEDKAVEFKGSLSAFLENDDEVKDIFEALATRISAIGAMKSAGFGEVESLKFDWNESKKIAPEIVDGERFRCEISFNKPFLVDCDRENDNVFISNSVIPGGAIKGALARKLELSGEDARNNHALSELRIGHAWHPKMKRPMRMSIMASEANAFDTLGSPNVPDNKALAYGAWKKHWDVFDKFGFGQEEKIGYDTRAHVTISNNTAEDGGLFFESAVDPKDEKWQFFVDFGRVDSKDRNALMDALFGELEFLGGTATSVKIEAKTEEFQGSVPQEKYAIVLNTPACLHAAYDENIFESYRKYFKSNYDLVLCDFAASQSYRGGFQGDWQGQNYQPFIVTDAGSVFLVEGKNSAIEEALRFGLKCAVSDEWQICPFQPENGYGEFRVEAQELKPC